MSRLGEEGKEKGGRGEKRGKGELGDEKGEIKRSIREMLSQIF